MRLTITLLLLCAVGLSRVTATHIKGGHIEYRQTSANTFEFTFFGYRDAEGVLFGNGVFDFGDGINLGGPTGEVIPWEFPTTEVSGVEIWRFSVVHTYENPGSYIVSYTEDFRNEGIQNMEGSVSTAFYVEASIVNDPLLEFNSSPTFSIPALIGVQGQLYRSTFFAQDPDGDSLAFRTALPKFEKDQVVAEYSYPNDPLLYDGDPGIYGISSREGNLTWDPANLSVIPPLEAREFSVAVQVEQWRDGFLIGTTTFDYNIEIWNLSSASGRISFSLPSSRCIDLAAANRDTLFVQNTTSSDLSIRFYADDAAFKVDGLSVQAWNEQVDEQPISESDFMIPIEFDAVMSSEVHTARPIQMEVRYEVPLSNPERPEIRLSQTLMYRQDCREALVLGSSRVALPGFWVSSDQIHFTQGHPYREVLMTDVSGRSLLGMKIEGRQTIRYNFEKNTVYLLRLVSDQKVVTKKFMIK